MMRTYCFSFLILACVSELCIFGISVSSVPQRSPCVCTSICAHTEYVWICCTCTWTIFKCVCMCVCVCKMCVTSRSDRGVLSPSGRCCSRARTMQFAMMVVRIIHSNGVQLGLKPIAPGRSTSYTVHNTAAIHTTKIQPPTHANIFTMDLKRSPAYQVTFFFLLLWISVYIFTILCNVTQPRKCKSANLSALLEQVKQVEFFGPAMFLNTTTEDVVFKNI